MGNLEVKSESECTKQLIHILTNIYLSIVLKIGFENILNISWFRSVNLISERVEQPVSPVLGSKISHVMVQPVEVQHLIEDGASNSVVLLFTMPFVQFSEQNLNHQKSQRCRQCCKEIRI